MSDEQLIDLIRQCDVLYNVTSNEYRDVKMRQAAWEDIARLHGKSVDECKENWNKLRNCYNNATKRRQKKGGKDGKKFAPWRFERQMSFLKPYLGGRNAMDNSGEYEDPHVAASDHDIQPESMLFTDNNPFKIEMVSSPESICTMTPSSNSSYKIKASPSNDNYLGDMMEMMRSTHERQELDDVDHFFLSMSKMLKKLPKLDQIKIKMDLHKAINEAELKQLE